MKRQEKVERFDFVKLMTRFASLIVVSVLILQFATTQVSAKSLVEPGDENYIRIGEHVTGQCAYRTEPEPIITTHVARVGNTRQMVATGTEITGWWPVSDGAVGFVRADLSGTPVYEAVKTDLINNLSLQKQKYNNIFVGQYLWTPTSEADMQMYLNIAKNVIVDLIKEGVIKNGTVGFMGASANATGKLVFDAPVTEPKYYSYKINYEYTGERADEFFQKHPELKKYFKNGR